MTAADDSSAAQRLVGIQTDFATVPPSIHHWAEETLGAPVVDIQPRFGGMSPAAAVSLRAANGARAFVKAVSADINPDTPKHFRHEMAVLAALPPAPYRAGLLSTYDDGHWVALALEDVDGRHPDWSSADDRAMVLAEVQAQASELTPIPNRLPAQSARTPIAKHVTTMQAAEPGELDGLPAWAVDELPRLLELAEQCLDHHRDETFCHFDLRHDNILIRHRDGQPVLLDWGMSRRGQRWGDTAVFALEWVDSTRFDDIVATADLSAQDDIDITGFLAGIGCFMCMVSTRPALPGLPHLPAFRRQLGMACLAGVRRRLQGTATD